MQSAALPFRPRAADPTDPTVESLAQQASEGRGRMNRMALLHAAFLSLSSVLLSLAVLVELAPRLATGRFALATWLLAAVSTAVAIVCLMRLRGSWVSSKQAATVIDRRAALQDRLTTLLSVGPEARASRLWDHLREENLRLKPRWTPTVLVPELAPWSLWIFALALLVSSYSVWQSPARTHGRSAPATGRAERAPDFAPPGRDAAGGQDGAASEESTWSELPQELQQAILGSAPSQEVQGSAPKKTTGVENEIPGASAIVDPNMKSSGPTRSVPATADAKQMANPPAGGQAAQPAPSSDKPKEGAGAPVPAAPMHGDAPKTLAPEKGRALSPQDKKLDKKQPSPTGQGGTGSAGAGSGGDKDGLFGEKQAVGGASSSFSLDLDAMRGDDGTDKGDGDTGPRVDSALAPNQRVDDAIRRAQVPAEYEAIVQRLFNRSADDADRPQGAR